MITPGLCECADCGSYLVACLACHGKGVVPNEVDVSCRKCGGDGLQARYTAREMYVLASTGVEPCYVKDLVTALRNVLEMSGPPWKEKDVAVVRAAWDTLYACTPNEKFVAAGKGGPS